MKRTKDVALMAIILMFCSIGAQSVFAASTIVRPAVTTRPAVNTARPVPVAATAVPVNITTAPSTYPLQAGKSGTFTVSFSGTGIAQVVAQPSGAGLSTRVVTNRQSSPNMYTSNITVIAAANFQGGTVMFALLNTNHGVIKSQTIAIPIIPNPAAANPASNAGKQAANTAIPAAANSVPVAITAAPSTYPLQAGKSGTFAVSFSGTGVAQVLAQPSGNGLAARVVNTSRQPSPNTYTSNISVTAANNFQGGTVTFALVNNSRNILKTQPITISAIPNPVANAANSTATAANSNPVTITAPDTFNVQAGKSTPLTVSFSGTGATRAALKVSGAGLSASLNTSLKPYPTPSTSNIAITPASSSKGGTITFQVTNSAGAVIGSKMIAVSVINAAQNTTAANLATNAVTNSNANIANSSPVTITAPDTFSVQAGKSTPLTVSFSGTGAARAALKVSGAGLAASLNTSLKPYPTPSTSNIAITPATGSQGGTITFQVSNSSGAVIGSKTINVSVSPATNGAGSTTAGANQITPPANPATTAGTGLAATSPNQAAVVGSPTASATIQQANTYISQLQTLDQKSQTGQVPTSTISQAKAASDNLNGLRSNDAQEQSALAAKAAYGACLYAGIKQRSTGLSATSCGQTPGDSTIITQTQTGQITTTVTPTTPITPTTPATPATTVTGLTATSPTQAAVVGAPAVSAPIQQANTYISQLQTLDQQSQAGNTSVSIKSQANTALANLKGLQSGNAQEQSVLTAKAAYGACLYDDITQRLTHLSPKSCGTPPPDTVAQTQTGQATITTGQTNEGSTPGNTTQQLVLDATVNRNSGTTDDTFKFSAITNVVPARVVIVTNINGATTTYSMTSSDNKNWNLSLTGDKLGTESKSIEIRGYPQNSMTSVTKTLNMNISLAPLTLTGVTVDKSSGTTNDTFAFSAVTNVAPSMVSVGGITPAGTATTYPMKSSDNRNWNLSLTGDKLGTGNRQIEIKAIPQNSQTSLTKTLAINITQVPTPSQGFDPVWPVRSSDGTKIVCLHISALSKYSAKNSYHSTRWSKGDGKTGMTTPENKGKTGMDIPRHEPGDIVVAVESGKVTTSSWSDTGFGNHVIIDHGNGMQSLYGHLASIDKTGWGSDGHVSKGQKIGTVGKTGCGDCGPHLHFEFNNANPYQDYFKGKYTISCEGPACSELNGTIW